MISPRTSRSSSSRISLAPPLRWLLIRNSRGSSRVSINFRAQITLRYSPNSSHYSSRNSDNNIRISHINRDKNGSKLVPLTILPIPRGGAGGKRLESRKGKKKVLKRPQKIKRANRLFSRTSHVVDTMRLLISSTLQMSTLLSSLEDMEEQEDNLVLQAPEG